MAESGLLSSCGTTTEYLSENLRSCDDAPDLPAAKDDDGKYAESWALERSAGADCRETVAAIKEWDDKRRKK